MSASEHLNKDQHRASIVHKPLMSMPWDDPDVRMQNITSHMWDKYDNNPYNDDEVLNLSYQGTDPADIIANRSH